MTRLLSGFGLRLPDPARAGARCKSASPRLAAALACALSMVCAVRVSAQNPLTAEPAHAYFLDCSAATSGDGSLAHPWNALAQAEAHPFAPGDRIALKRGTVCKGAFAPQGSGNAEHIIRLSAYGAGPRPRIVAPSTARQAFLLFNQEYWQIDSLDIAGGSQYGVFVTGDKGTLHHLYLKNLYVHDVYGGAFKNKDNGLVIVGPSSIDVFFDDILIDGVDAAHTNQWAGILIGGGSFPYKDDAPLNTNVQIRNSTVHDVYGDGIVLFRDAHSSIRSSAAWETGMQPTQDVGTPNAIWTWTCTDCTVAGNEAYLTDSPGVDGGAYDIDWNDHQNIVENNYAHDTQGYCIAVFGAGYVTSDSLVQDNLCIDNALSPRMSATEGAINLSTWNGGALRGLTIRDNQIQWNPRVPGSPAIVAPADVDGRPIVFNGNTVESTSPLIYNLKTPWLSSANKYILDGMPLFTIGENKNRGLDALQAQGMEDRSTVVNVSSRQFQNSLRIEASILPALEEDGLLSDDARAQLIVLRSLAGQYDPRRLRVTVHLPVGTPIDAETNALNDLGSVYPGALEFVRDSSPLSRKNELRLLGPDGKLIEQWEGDVNPATLGDAVRAHLGPPDFSHMQPLESTPESGEAPQ